MSGGRLPGADAGRERIVLHVDMDCFYASCERRRDPDLRGEPVVVGMGYEEDETHGAVATASYEARECGVESAQAISTALSLLPRRGEGDGDRATGHYRPVDMDYYESVAAEVEEVLRECADTIRVVSIDEAYLDVTERTGWQEVDGRTLAEGYARHVKERIEREAGVPASVGVAPNMSAAKVASDHDKPDGLVVVPPGTVREFLAPLSVEAVHGVGPVTAGELREMGVETAGDLATADPTTLQDRFGQRGRTFHERARGNDHREVTPRGRPKSLSRESALPEPTDEASRVREVVSGLAADVAERARQRDALYRTIGIKVVTPPFDVQTRAQSLPGPVDDPDLVEGVALDLLTEYEGETVRKVGVRVSNLSFGAADQASLEGWGGERREDGDDSTDGDDAAADTDDDATVEGDGRRRGQVSLRDFDG